MAGETAYKEYLNNLKKTWEKEEKKIVKSVYILSIFCVIFFDSLVFYFLSNAPFLSKNFFLDFMFWSPFLFCAFVIIAIPRAKRWETRHAMFLSNKAIALGILFSPLLCLYILSEIFNKIFCILVLTIIFEFILLRMLQYFKINIKKLS